MCPPPCSCATEMKRMPASGNRSSASIYAEPTMPNTSVTPCATRVSTKASDGVMVLRPVTTARLPALAARFLLSVIVFISAPGKRLWRNAGSPAVDSLRFGELVQHRLWLEVFVAKRVGDRLAGDLAEGDVQSILQMRIVGKRLFPALVGKREDERQRGIVECERGGARHTSWHVGDAIMDHAVDDI